MEEHRVLVLKPGSSSNTLEKSLAENDGGIHLVRATLLSASVCLEYWIVVWDWGLLLSLDSIFAMQEVDSSMVLSQIEMDH